MDDAKRRQLEAEYQQADHWNYKTDPYEIRKYDQTLALVPPGHYARALEIGCSEGIFTRRLASLANEVLGVDVVPLALARARLECAGLVNVHFQQLDLYADTLPEQFDLIFCAEVLYYLRWTRLRPVTRKIVSWLRPGGYLVAVHATNAVAEGWGFGPKGAELTHRLLARPGVRRVADEDCGTYVLTLFRKETDEGLSAWQAQLDNLVGLNYAALARAGAHRVMRQLNLRRGQ